MCKKSLCRSDNMRVLNSRKHAPKGGGLFLGIDLKGITACIGIGTEFSPGEILARNQKSAEIQKASSLTGFPQHRNQMQGVLK